MKMKRCVGDPHRRKDDARDEIKTEPHADGVRADMHDAVQRTELDEAPGERRPGEDFEVVERNVIAPVATVVGDCPGVVDLDRQAILVVQVGELGVNSECVETRPLGFIVYAGVGLDVLDTTARAVDVGTGVVRVVLSSTQQALDVTDVILTEAPQ